MNSASWNEQYDGALSPHLLGPGVHPAVATSVIITLCAIPFCNITNSFSRLRLYCVTLFPDIWTLRLIYNGRPHCSAPAQCLQPVRVARPWHSRTLLPRRTPLLRHCTLTLWWDQCLRRIQKMRTKRSQMSSWRRRRHGPCRRHPAALTAPTRWDSNILTVP